MDTFIQKINQIGIVTDDLKAMVQRYEEVYGIHGWTVIDGKAGFDPDAKAKNLCTRGVPGDFEISLAKAMVGEIEIELIQPLDNKSDYAQFLRKNGCGVHHISIDTDAGRFRQLMIQRNVPELLRGTIPGAETFLYYETGPEIGMTVEIHDFENK